jgi:hypothetical protein
VTTTMEDTTTYPNLGFNPVPGIPADVESMSSAVAQAVASMRESGSLLDQLRNATSGVWQGSAGDAFRQHFDGKLVTDLQNAHTSLNNAVSVLTNWHGDLLGFKDMAAKLDQAAAEAKLAVQRAEQSLAQAKNNPDLQLVGQYFNTQHDLQAAQARIDAAESGVRDAANAAQHASDELASVMKRAEELAAQHESMARRYAQQLEQATKGLAPSPPGFFSSMWNDFTGGLSAVGGWLKNHVNAIHSVLSTISAVAGLIALCTPPPIDAVAGAVAIGAGVGALACDLANPKVRDAVGGLLTGHFTMANLKNASSMGLDALSVIPGGKLIGSAFKEGDVALGVAAKLGADGSSVVRAGVDAVDTIPTLASKIPGLSSLGGDAATAFGDAAQNASNVVKTGSNLAHSLSVPVKLGVSAANKVFNFADVATVEGAQTFAHVAGNVQLGWQAKSLVTSLYGDIKQAF